MNNNMTITNEGAVAFKNTTLVELVSLVLTSFFGEAKFYESCCAERLITLLTQVIGEGKRGARFCSKLAVYARRVFNMRSTPHVICAILAHEVNGKPFVADTIRGVVVRGDDITAILARYMSLYGNRKIPNSLKKGLANAIGTLDEYSMAKYAKGSNGVKMKDAILLTHPKPESDKDAALYRRCIEDKLATPATWEVTLSKMGNTKEAWETLIDSGKVGYMALLRNMRNILMANPCNLDKVLDHLSNPNAVRASKQLPFRFMQAYRTLADSCSFVTVSSKVFDALEKAMEASTDNIEKLPGRTVIAIDTSGSMNSRLSKNSAISCADIAMTLGVIANRICEDAIVFTFDTYLKQLPISSDANMLQTISLYSSCGGGTFMDLPFKKMLDDGIYADRVIVISDNEVSGSFNDLQYLEYRETEFVPVSTLIERYRENINPNLWVHGIDIQGYGTQQFIGSHTNVIGGWSEKVFDFISLAEKGESNLIDTIAEYEW